MGGSIQLPTPGSVRLPRGWVSSVADPGQLGCRIAHKRKIKKKKQKRGSIEAEDVDEVWHTGCMAEQQP
jgi:hypothetical protein